MTNTYIKFGPNGSSNDYALLRQIGSTNDIHLTLDFHDDAGDAEFSIRDVQSWQTPDAGPYTRFIVKGSNVGIGSSSPDTNLDVVGTTKMTQTLSIGGALVLSSDLSTSGKVILGSHLSVAKSNIIK